MPQEFRFLARESISASALPKSKRLIECLFKLDLLDIRAKKLPIPEVMKGCKT